MSNVIDTVQVRIDADTTLFDRKMQRIREQFRQIQRIQVDMQQRTTQGGGLGGAGSALLGGLAGAAITSSAKGSGSSIRQIEQKSNALQKAANSTQALTEKSKRMKSVWGGLISVASKYKSRQEAFTKGKAEMVQAQRRFLESAREVRAELNKKLKSPFVKGDLRKAISTAKMQIDKGSITNFKVFNKQLANIEDRFNKAQHASQRFNRALVKIRNAGLVAFKGIRAGITKVASSFASVGKSALGGMKKIFRKIKFAGLAAFAAITLAARRGFIEGMDDKRATANLNAAINATGKQINLTTDQIKDMVKSLDTTTNFGRAELTNAAALLSTFTNIKSDTFEDVLGVATDLSAAFGTDLKSSVIQLGKALNDPIRGMTALSRSGVSFSDQDRERVRNLVEQNKLLEAQEFIIGSIRSQGIAGQAMTDSVTQTKKGFEDFRKEIATMFVKFFRLKDLFDKGRKTFDNLSARIRAFVQSNGFAEWSARTLNFVKQVWISYDILGRNLIGWIKHIANAWGGFFRWLGRQLVNTQEFMVWLIGGQEALNEFYLRRNRLQAELRANLSDIKPFEDIDFAGALPIVEDMDDISDAIDGITDSVQELQRTVGQGQGATSIFDSVLEGMNQLMSGNVTKRMREIQATLMGDRVAQAQRGTPIVGDGITSGLGVGTNVNIYTQLINAIRNQTDTLNGSLLKIDSSINDLSLSPLL